jgi:glycosyltransferase involved in cell wall biosynthesis
MPAPSVSIIVPTFNRAQYLAECLDSLLAQTFSNAQIIVVNDGSTDETARVVRPYIHHIKYIEKANGGKSSAINMVLPSVESQLVWIFDDDDVALPDALETHVMALEDHPEAGFTYSAFWEGRNDPSGKIVREKIRELKEWPNGSLFIQLLEGRFVPQQASVVRLECYRKVGPFDIRLIRSQDSDMILRLSRHFKGARIEQPTCIIRRHEGLRGNQENRFPAKLRTQNWFPYNRIIFEKLYDSLRLEEYLPEDRRQTYLDSNANREAHIRKLSVMARQGLWNHVVTEIEQLYREGGNREPLTELEKRLCNAATYNSWSATTLLSDNSVHRAITRHCNGLGGSQMRFEFVRGLYQMIENANLMNRMLLTPKFLAFAFQTLGAKGLMECVKYKIGMRSEFL